MGFSSGRGLRPVEAPPAPFIWRRAGSRRGLWCGAPGRREGANPQPPARRLLGADDGAEDVLEHARERRVRRQGFLRRATDAVNLLGEELADEDARLEAEGLHLAAGRRELEGAIALAPSARS